MLRIIRANHEHDQVGRYIIHRAILQTPENMLRTVSAKTEVERLIVSEIIIPNILAFGFPPMGDGIAQQDNLYRLLRLLLLQQFRLMPRPPPLHRPFSGMNNGLDGERLGCIGRAAGG